MRPNSFQHRPSGFIEFPRNHMAAIATCEPAGDAGHHCDSAAYAVSPGLLSQSESSEASALLLIDLLY